MAAEFYLVYATYEINSQAEYECNDTQPNGERLQFIGETAYIYVLMCYDFGNKIFSNGLQNIKVENPNATFDEIISVDLWKKGNHLIWNIFQIMLCPVKKDSHQYIKKYTDLIRRCESEYQPPVLPDVKSSGCVTLRLVFMVHMTVLRCAYYVVTVINILQKVFEKRHLYVLIMQ